MGIMERAQDSAHERKISVSIYGANDGNIIVEGRLVDDRLNDFYLMTGEKRPACEIHNFVVRWLVETSTMTIVEAEAEAHAVPRDECRGVENGALALVGLRIAPGFSAKIRSILSGTKGCTHILTLVGAMAPAALQGYWSYRSRKSLEIGDSASERDRLTLLLKVVANSCIVWRDDGPSMKRLNETIEKLKKY